jgi:hypothetical protein
MSFINFKLIYNLNNNNYNNINYCNQRYICSSSQTLKAAMFFFPLLID